MARVVFWPTFTQTSTAHSGRMAHLPSGICLLGGPRPKSGPAAFHPKPLYDILQLTASGALPSDKTRHPGKNEP
jgi:hypothetical protein